MTIQNTISTKTLNDNLLHKRLVFLDVVRGLAALSVLFSHLDYSYLDSNGFLYKMIDGYNMLFQKIIWVNSGLHPGVIVFIVLSGFCIHMPQAFKNQFEINPRTFIRKRFFRIYPVFFVSLMMGIIISMVSRQSTSISLDAILAHLFLISAIFPFTPPAGNGILLTVIVECFLYCLYPVGLWAIRTLSWKYLFAFCLAAYVANLLCYVFTASDPVWIQRNLCALLLYWWLGAFAVNICVRRSILDEILPWHCCVAYGGYFLFCSLLKFQGSHTIKSLIFAILVAFFLAALFQHEKSKNKNAIKQRMLPFFKWIGERSYSLYVVHIPVLCLLNLYCLNFFTNTLGCGGIYYPFSILIVLLSTISLYKLVEKPSHAYARNGKSAAKYFSQTNEEMVPFLCKEGQPGLKNDVSIHHETMGMMPITSTAAKE